MGKEQKIKTRADAEQWIEDNVLSGEFYKNAPKRFNLDRFKEYTSGKTFPVSDIIERLLKTESFFGLAVFDQIRICAVLQRAEGEKDYAPVYLNSKEETKLVLIIWNIYVKVK